MRSGLKREDNIVKINNKTPKNMEHAVEILKKSKVRRVKQETASKGFKKQLLLILMGRGFWMKVEQITWIISKKKRFSEIEIE